jgi:hypothetical protein
MSLSVVSTVSSRIPGPHQLVVSGVSVQPLRSRRIASATFYANPATAHVAGTFNKEIRGICTCAFRKICLPFTCPPLRRGTSASPSVTCQVLTPT